MSKHDDGLDLRVFLISNVILLSASLGFAITLTTIDVPGAASTTLNGVNARGHIVGTYSSGSQTHGFLLDQGTFETIDVPGATRTEPREINDSGQIVGFYLIVRRLTASF